MEATLWPYGKCEKCANKNYCAWSQNEILNCMNNGYPNFSPMRNADRIRAMSDEEMAEWIDHIQFDAYERGVMETSVVDYPNTYSKWLDWLKQEVSTNG